MFSKEINKNKGFTLIELLVIIAILSLLSSIILISIQSVRGNARDTARVAQLDQVRKALEMYYAKYGQYPTNELTTNIPNNWSSMITKLQNEGMIGEIDENINKMGYLENLMMFFPQNVKAADRYLQDPFYDASTYDRINYPYSFGYMPGHNQAIPKDYQNFRIRAKLENLNSSYLRSGYDGYFLYGDSDTGWHACDSSEGYFCLG